MKVVDKWSAWHTCRGLHRYLLQWRHRSYLRRGWAGRVILMMHSEYYGWVLELLCTWEESMLEARQLQEEEATNLELQEEEALNQGLSTSLLHREGGQLMSPRLLCGGAEGRADQRVSAGPLSNTTGGEAILSSPTAAPHVADPLSPPVYDGNSDEHGDDIHGRNLFDDFFDENSDDEEYSGVYY